jgi:alpha-amylase
VRSACAARNFASKSQATDGLRTFFRDDDYYTDADSNAYQLPTFLGNHDMGHIGMFIRDDNPTGTPESELLARDELAHELMYLSRGNPVVYFGDEQGFTGAGNDQAARQDMFASQDPEYDNVGDDAGKNDDIGSNATPANDNFDPDHPLYKGIKRLADLTRAHPALRNGAQQHRYSSGEAGVYAFSRLPQGAARVRRGAQQCRDGEDRDVPDLDGVDALRPAVRQRRGELDHRRRPPAQGDGAAAVGGRLRGGEAVAAL